MKKVMINNAFELLGFLDRRNKALRQVLWRRVDLQHAGLQATALALRLGFGLWLGGHGVRLFFFLRSRTISFINVKGSL